MNTCTHKKIGENQSGQVLTEYLLILVVAMGFIIFASSQLEKMGFAQKLISKPWEKLSGMIECGSWTKCGVGKGVKGIHASYGAHYQTIEGDRFQ